MHEQQFRSVATTAVAGLTVDTDRVLAGVYRRTRRRRAVLALGSLAGVATLSGISALGVSAVAERPDDATTVVAAPSPGTGAGLRSYQMATEARPVVVEVDGVGFTYLPAGTSPVPVEEEVTPTFDGGGHHVTACFLDGCEDGISVRVSRAAALDLDAYVEDNWLGDARPTEVSGRPALATRIGLDETEAAGLVWSPAEGLVVELNVPPEQRPELRRIVEGMWISTP